MTNLIHFFVLDKGHFNLLHNLNIFDQYPFLWKSKFYKYFWNTFFPPYHRRHLQSKSACLCSKRFGVILLLLIPLSEHWACPHCEQVIYSCLSDNSYSLVTVERLSDYILLFFSVFAHK